MSLMTTKERILAAMQRQEVDHVPCCPVMNFQDWPQRLGKQWQFPFGPSMQETLEYMIHRMKVDQVVGFSMGFYPEPEVTSRVWLEDNIIHKVWMTPSGELHAAVKYNEYWPLGLDIPLFSDYLPAHLVEPWIKTMKDVECIRHLLHPPQKKEDVDRLRFDRWELNLLAERYQLPICFYFGYGLTGALMTFGPEMLCEMTITHPEVVDAYLEIDHQWIMKTYEIALDLGVDFVRRNGFYESCDYYSPAMLQRFLFRRLEDEIRLVHQAGKPIAYTLLSGIMPMLDYLARLKFDSIICPDVFFQGVDAKVINEKLGNEKSFWTGPSDTIHLPWDKPEKVCQAVQHVFDAFGTRGLVLAPCSSSKAVFPWSNIIAMIDEWRRLIHHDHENTGP